MAPTMLSDCAAGPVRVCHSNSDAAASAGAAAASVRRNSERSARLRIASRVQPISPVTGKAAMTTAVRQPWP